MSTSTGFWEPSDEEIERAVRQAENVGDLTPEEADRILETSLDSALLGDPVARAFAEVMGGTAKKTSAPAQLAPAPWYERYYGRLAKSIIYRVYSSTVTMFISYAVTHKWSLSIALGVLDFCVKIFTYWAFEMGWWKIVKSTPLRTVFHT